MKNKISVFILLTAIIVFSIGLNAFSSESNNVGELKKLLDAIIVYNVNSSGAKNTVEWLADGAGGGTDFYAIALRQLNAGADLSAYADAIESYIASNDVKSQVTRQKNALALIAAGKRDSELISDTADSTIGAMGIMSYIYGLHLLNNGAPSSDFTAADVINQLISMQFDDGGWAISGKYSDIDVTSMIVQAMAPHIYEDEKTTESINRAIAFLSEKQLENGGFQSYGTENCESSAQAIIALTSVGIDPLRDERFIKNGNNAFDGLMIYRLDDGSFCHTKDASSNGMATYQAFLAISALIRFESGLGPLYVFDEASETKEEEILYEEPETEVIPSESEPETTEENAKTIEETHAETAVEEVSGESDGKIWIIAVIAAVAAVMIVVCVIKKQKPATFVFVIAVAAGLSAVVWFTDVQAPGDYYGKTQNKENSVGKVTIQIRCDLLTDYDSEYIPKDGVIVPTTEFDIEEGDTVYDILVETVKMYSLHIETTGPKNMVYVNGINHLYEFDYGDLSGWIYKVNGETVSVGCGQCVLHDGDEIVWHYTLELGIDLD